MENEENLANAPLRLLKLLQSELSGMRSDMQSEFRDVKGRLSHLESSVAAVRRDGAMATPHDGRALPSIDSFAVISLCSAKKLSACALDLQTG